MRREDMRRGRRVGRVCVRRGRSVGCERGVRS